MRIQTRHCLLLFYLLLAEVSDRIILNAAAPAGPQEDYNQWKEALGTNAATVAKHITPLPGFAVELIRSAQPG